MMIEVLKSKIHRVVIIASYAAMEFEDAKAIKPAIIFPDENINI